MQGTVFVLGQKDDLARVRPLTSALIGAGFRVVPFQSGVPMREKLHEADALVVCVDRDIFAQTALEIANRYPGLPLFVIGGNGRRIKGLPRSISYLNGRCGANLFLSLVQEKVVPFASSPYGFDGELAYEDE